MLKSFVSRVLLFGLVACYVLTFVSGSGHSNLKDGANDDNSGMSHRHHIDRVEESDHSKKTNREVAQERKDALEKQIVENRATHHGANESQNFHSKHKGK